MDMTMATKATSTHRRIAGIVLAGGRSSRMGTNKALLPYRGRPLVEHMMGKLLQAGCIDVHISGEVPGYQGVPDMARYEGPARAITGLMTRFKGKYDGFLFVPVDMPLLAMEALEELLHQTGSAFYDGHPLPAFILSSPSDEAGPSIRAVLQAVDAKAISLPEEWERGMANINTKEEWEALAS
jgi:molybdenum cofactor guanylyltransferase